MSEKQGPMASSSPRKIHIIDDDQQTVMVLKHILQSRDYDVRYSLSGDEALGEFNGYTPDLILLDILMPGMDGYEVCRSLKKHPTLGKVPVIFITASNDTDELVKGFDAGAVDFISKPLNRAELLARINTHLELKLTRDLIEEKNKALQQEISNRKQAEEKFKALSETTFEAVIFVQNNRIIEMNRAAQELFSIDPGKGEFPEISSLTDNDGSELLNNIIQKHDKAGPWELSFFGKNKKMFFGQVQYLPFRYLGDEVSVLAIRDITRQKEIDKEIFNAIIDAEENQRKRFARDMHDGLGALLSTLKIYVNLFQKNNKNEEEKKMLVDEMKDTINRAVESARTIANNIMPSVLMDHGLVKALRSFTEALNKTGAMQVIFEPAATDLSLNANTETHLYRISLELINNTLKHADATRIHLKIYQKNKTIMLEYNDNGKGFDMDKILMENTGSQGLKNILNRLNFMNGKGVFSTAPGQGLSFKLEVPA